VSFCDHLSEIIIITNLKYTVIFHNEFYAFILKQYLVYVNLNVVFFTTSLDKLNLIDIFYIETLPVVKIICILRKKEKKKKKKKKKTIS